MKLLKLALCFELMFCSIPTSHVRGSSETVTPQVAFKGDFLLSAETVFAGYKPSTLSIPVPEIKPAVVLAAEPVPQPVKKPKTVQKAPQATQKKQQYDSSSLKESARLKLVEIWGEGQFESFNKLLNAESGWNPNAKNPKSTAYGLCQFLDGTWRGTGIAKTSDPNQQLEACIIYVKNRYGSPNGAWSFWQKNHWY